MVHAVLTTILPKPLAATCSSTTVTAVSVCSARRCPKPSLLTRPPVPVDTTSIKTLYIFVEVGIDSKHLAQTVRLNFPDDRERFHAKVLDDGSTDLPPGSHIGPARPLMISASDEISLENSGVDSTSRTEPTIPTHLALVSTVQFVAALQDLKDNLSEAAPAVQTDAPNCSSVESACSCGSYQATIPQAKPLSPGEILGCTAPTLSNVDALLFVLLLDTVLPIFSAYVFSFSAISETGDSIWSPS